MVTPTYNYRQVILRAFENISNRIAVGLGAQLPDGTTGKVPATGIDSNNTTTTALGADETFTGGWTDISNYATAGLLVYTDQDSATLGLLFELSDDGVNVRSDDSYTLGAGLGKIYTVPLIGKYFRVSYTNGATPQAAGGFGIQTKLFSESPKPSSHSINDSIASQDDAELVKSVITAQEEATGNFVNVAASGGMNLLVAIGQRLSEVRGRTPVQKNIENSSLDATGIVIHTVTSGKNFFLQSLVISALNSANAVGRVTVQDNTTVVIPFLLEARDGVVPAKLQAVGIPFADPLEFSTDVRIVALSGTVVASVTIVGYEEDA